ncbi:unnamed protein product [Phytophthora fragariaefolia]|uniref:Unnamed protein product n=1 Tax=Phytophthora fragariaefolia TaxID=1490495 RepID=A0A9W7D0M9_9STRA|nr:unnamed protein product [Phytophthora fragariaefolia]
MENVAQGMSNIGQPWATAPSRHVVPMEGTMGPTTIIPGISSAIPTNRTDGGVATRSEVEHVAMFTNPQGIYNKFSGKWDKPPGHRWNGKYWYEPMQVGRKRMATRDAHELKHAGSRPPAKRERRVVAESSDSENELKLQRKKKCKVAVKQLTTQEKSANGARPVLAEPVTRERRCFRCGESTHWATECPNDIRYYACRQYGHMARECPDTEAKTRNDDYLKKRELMPKPAENEQRA